MYYPPLFRKNKLFSNIRNKILTETKTNQHDQATDQSDYSGISIRIMIFKKSLL